MESPKFGSHKSAEQWQSQLQQRGLDARTYQRGDRNW